MAVKFPKTVGSAVDALHRLKLKKDGAEVVVNKIKDDYNKLQDHIFSLLNKQDSTGAKGNLAQVTVIHQVVPTLDEYPDLIKYIKKTGSFDLLQKRLSSTAIKLRWEDGKEVPGVGRFTKVSLRLIKIKK